MAREVKVPVAPQPCVIPAWHVPAECKNDIPCILLDYAATLDADRAIEAALKTCPEVRNG